MRYSLCFDEGDGVWANPKFPDVYYACDVCFVPPVAEQFPEAVLLTETAIVIAVPEGNPAGIKTLSDLARGGLRVGLRMRNRAPSVS